MYLLADFGNKENKAKRKAAENRLSLDRVMSEIDSYGADPAYLAKEKAKELRVIRERRNLPLVDPLQYRAKQKGKGKITAPYKAKEGLYKLPSWSEKGTSEKLGREQSRGFRGADYVGSNNKISDNPKRQARVDEILKNKSNPKKALPSAPKPSPTVNKTQAKILENFTKVPEVKFIPPTIKAKIPSTTVKEAIANSPSTKVGGSGGLLLGAGLGLAGIGGALYLANRKKKENK